MKKLAWSASFLFFGCVCAFAEPLSESDYVTPESWSQHFSPDGIVKSLRMHELGGGTSVSM